MMVVTEFGSRIANKHPLVRLPPPSLRPDRLSAEHRAQAPPRRPRNGTGVSRRAASCVLGMSSSLGVKVPLCNLMEVKHE